ncbi:uncharacterized protein LOC133317342 [Gastrolobium bilobum]|uniref:uncharacterized protein LOC133317342 n=1 Tax=Gastrolobium bilobum TaxID=150636 RepID=UPI002AB07EB4|nr:uncharacterized protein LOC133317342 [Gastrolobium bilobum]
MLDLRDAVEKFVRDGRLRQYVIKTQGSKINKRKSGNINRSKSPVPEKKNKDERNQKNDSNHDEFPEAKFDCNVISEALGGGGDTVSARRKYLKEVLFIRDHPKFKKDQANQTLLSCISQKSVCKESRGCYFDTVKENEGGHSSPPRIHPGDKLGKETIPHHSRKPVNVVELDMKKEIILRREPDRELEDLALEKEPSQFTRIGKTIDPQIKQQLVGFLKSNTDVFAWKSSEIPGIDPAFYCHKLAVYPGSTSVSQKKMKLGPERKQVLEEHVKELLDAEFIREIQCTTWLANVVMVKKPNGKWRVCTDYTDLNKIPMYPGDQEKTAFIAEKANYCYNVMSFGLKNSWATYQRMMNNDLEQTFQKLREYRIRLNSVKCAFGVPAGKILGFMLTHRGIEANPDKCKAMLDMKVPQNKKEVQQLTGRLAALTRFLPKSAQNALPFFKLLKKEVREGWNPECQAAFEKVKKCLATPPVLSKPEPGDTLILYLAVGEEAINVVLIKETDKGQELIYFISRALQGAEVRYQKLEKVAFALLITARRLRLYFQGHQIIVLTNQPIRQVLHKPDLVGRMTNWAIELSEYDITYEIRKAIESQALADFIMELTPVNPEYSKSRDAWKVYVDGSSNDKGSGAEIILESPEGVTIEHSLNLGFPTSNNQAEYEALIARLMQAKEHGAKKVKVFSDSQLATSQIEGKYQAKGLILMKYLSKVQEMMADFDEVQVTHIPRGENCRADILSKLASTKNPGNHRTVVQQSITMPSCMMIITSTNDWRQPMVPYLEKGILPEDRLESKKLVRDAAQYTIMNDQLFRKRLHVPMLKCLNSEEAEYVLSEIHEGINGHHMGGKALARTALRAGYYWSTMEADAKEHVKRCDSFQKHAKLILSPPEELKYISAPWPFFKWGMDLFGIPAEVVTDNGMQFADKRFQQLMKDLQVKHCFAYVEQPQSNGQVEAANKNEYPNCNRENPFSTDIWLRSHDPGGNQRTSWKKMNSNEQGEQQNNKLLTAELDLADEARVAAHCRDMMAKWQMTVRYNKKVRPRIFEKDDLVPRRVDIGNKNAIDGKLAANWEEPYQVREKLGKGAYILETVEGKELSGPGMRIS